MGEFDLIARYFKHPALGPEVALGVGDDCALLNHTPGMQWAVSSDMLVAGRHFFEDVDPTALGHKALAVNLSDLAACGARPVAFTLALSLPQADEAWLRAFSEGLMSLAQQHACSLVGGDTTRGPLNICITVMGEVPHGQALLRSGARPGDEVYVSGHLGDARLALEALQAHRAQDAMPQTATSLATRDTTSATPRVPAWPASVLAAARQRLERPTPRVALGLALRGVASAAMDISDGLAGDLAHLLQASAVGATLNIDDALELIASRHHPALSTGQFDALLSRSDQQRLVVSGGDDYELLFTAPPQARDQVQAAARASGTPVHCIGRIDAQAGLRWVNRQGQALVVEQSSYDHFAAGAP